MVFGDVLSFLYRMHELDLTRNSVTAMVESGLPSSLLRLDGQ